jgi:hypothetical protein
MRHDSLGIPQASDGPTPIKHSVGRVEKSGAEGATCLDDTSTRPHSGGSKYVHRITAEGNSNQMNGLTHAYLHLASGGVPLINVALRQEDLG